MGIGGTQSEGGLGTDLQAPSPESVRIWIAQSDPSLDESNRSMLSEDELAEVDRRVRAEDRESVAFARTLWRRAAGACLKVDPTAIEIERNGFGRPQPIGVDRSELDLSASHTGTWSGVAAARGVRIGLDLERTVAAVSDDSVERAVEGIQGVGLEHVTNRAERMLLAWCTLESLVKADGRGLHLDPTQVTADFRTAWGWNPARVGGTGWWTRRIKTPGGLVGVIAASAPVSELDVILPD